MPVRAAALIGDPERAQIAFLEDMQHQVVAPRRLARGAMDRADVAVKHDVGHAFFGDDAVQVVGPVLGPAAVADEPGRVGPEEFVAGVEADAPDLGTGIAQQPADAVEERAVRPLQHQEDALAGGQGGGRRHRDQLALLLRLRIGRGKRARGSRGRRGGAQIAEMARGGHGIQHMSLVLFFFSGIRAFRCRRGPATEVICPLIAPKSRRCHGLS